MPASSAPADPGRDDDLAWLDRDPMTAQEREEWLDRVCEHDEPPKPEEYEDFGPLPTEELASAAGQFAAGHRGQRPPVHLVPGELAGDVVGHHVHRGAALLRQVAQPGQPPGRDQQRPGREPRGQGPADDLFPFGQENSVPRLHTDAEGGIGQRDVVGEPWISRVAHLDGASHPDRLQTGELPDLSAIAPIKSGAEAVGNHEFPDRRTP